MLDVTNTYSNRLALNTKPLATARYAPHDFVSKTFAPTSCNVSVCYCSHSERIQSISGHTSNCLKCGSFLISDSVFGIVRDTNASIAPNVSPSLLSSNMRINMDTNKTILRSMAPNLILARKKNIEWLFETGETMGMSIDSLHKASAFFDRILGKEQNNSNEKDLQEIVLICLLLSAKLTETDQTIDHIKSLFKSRFGIKGQLLKNKETQALNQLNWDLQCVTSFDFIQLFVAQGVVFTNDMVKTSRGNKIATLKVSESVRKYAEFFAEVCAQRHALTNYSALELACGIIAVARKQMKLINIWTHEVELLTGMRYIEIEKCVESIEKCYEKMFPKTGKSVEIKPTKGVMKLDSSKENIYSSISGARTSRAPSCLAMYNLLDLKGIKQ